GSVNLTQSLTVNKQGAGSRFLDNTGATGNNLTGATLNVQAGKLVAVGSGAAAATNPLGAATVQIAGGTLSLDTTVNNVTFDNAVNVTASGTLEAQSDNVTLTLGSATNGVNIAANQTLSVNTFGGSPTNMGNVPGVNLTLAGSVAGAGNLVKNNVPTFF